MMKTMSVMILILILVMSLTGCRYSCSAPEPAPEEPALSVPWHNSYAELYKQVRIDGHAYMKCVSCPATLSSDGSNVRLVDVKGLAIFVSAAAKGNGWSVCKDGRGAECPDCRKRRLGP